MRVALIPARSGSKGVPRKNEKPFCGKPLIAWSILAAMDSRRIDKVIVSTDGSSIAEIAKEYGAEVLLRPNHLAGDEIKTIDVLHYHLDLYPAANMLVVLQPTSPIRSASFIDYCIDEFEKGDYTNLATGFYCKYRAYGSHNNLRRQDIRGFFYDDGSIYLLKRALVEASQWSGTKPCSIVSERITNFEIDDEIDWIILEALMRKFQEKEGCRG